jgi:hypothetical protein
MTVLKCARACRKFTSIAVISALLFTACASHRQKQLDPKNCLDTIPQRVEGLTILEGPRTEQSIIRDMVPAICYGHFLFGRMKSSGEEVNPGVVVFRVVVEYTGEVYGVTVEETTIQSKLFLRRASDFIVDTDFVPWARDETDTAFLYPVEFGR